MSTLTLKNNHLIVQTPYNQGLVASIKSLPISERKYDPDTKSWLVAPQHGARVASWISQYLGEMVLVPQVSIKATKQTRILDVRYIGQCKQRDDGTLSAFGYQGGEWSVIFPQEVLQDWFENGSPTPAVPAKDQTLYQVLGIPATVVDADIKPAYRRMARQWHPDVNKEADAAERFMRIQEAYELLSNPGKRARYDAGLQLEKMTVSKSNQNTLARQMQKILSTYGYRSPLLCGYVMAEGIESLGRFTVSKILDWQDITDGNKTLVSSWPMGAKFPTETWV